MTSKLATLPNGKKIQAPGWANWAAQDAGGFWFCFKSKPEIHQTCWLQPKGERAAHKLYEGLPNEHWKNTLLSI